MSISDSPPAGQQVDPTGGLAPGKDAVPPEVMKDGQDDEKRGVKRPLDFSAAEPA